jgi:NADP-dependent 3-hydroxy acid dehydrogenase YdfG
MFTNNIKGKTALITGASAGIGEATAKKFAKCGVHLVLTARRIDKLESLKAQLATYSINTHIYQLDVRDSAAVQAFADKLKQDNIVPDILVNNAGLSVGKDPIYEAALEDWERMIDTNIKGLLYVTRAIVPMMMERNMGHIINLGSIAGLQVYPGGNVYNATKFAVRGLTEAMNVDLINTNIRVSLIAPGATNTEFSNVRFNGDQAKADAVYAGYQPLVAEDIADSIAYIANAPAHVNVQRMLVTPTAQRNVANVGKNIKA